MGKIIEGFYNEEHREYFELRLKEYNEMIFYVWKIGLNLALRVSDVLKITIKEAEIYIRKKEYLSKDKKTGKKNHVQLNQNTIKALEEAILLRKKIINPKNPYLFIGMGNRSKNYEGHMTRQTIFEAFKYIVNQENIDIHVGTHSMRKTWGYLAYKKTGDIIKVMKRLNHSKPEVTLLYIGITDKDIDDLVANMNL